MTDLDEYRRCGLHEDVNAVLSAAQRWRDDPSTDSVLALREAIDALARAYVDFGNAVDEYKGLPDEPSVLDHGGIVRKEKKHG